MRVGFQGIQRGAGGGGTRRTEAGDFLADVTSLGVAFARQIGVREERFGGEQVGFEKFLALVLGQFDRPFQGCDRRRVVVLALLVGLGVFLARLLVHLHEFELGCEV